MPDASPPQPTERPLLQITLSPPDAMIMCDALACYETLAILADEPIDKASPQSRAMFFEAMKQARAGRTIIERAGGHPMARATRLHTKILEWVREWPPSGWGSI